MSSQGGEVTYSFLIFGLDKLTIDYEETCLDVDCFALWSVCICSGI